MKSSRSSSLGCGLACAAMFVSVCAVSPANAAEDEAILGIELLPGWRTETGSHLAAVQIELAPGWKTYWRSPGEAGLPPVFDWSGSHNLIHAKVHWPRPSVFELNGLATIGYDGTVLLPVEVWPSAPGAHVSADVTLHLGVCRDVCVPVSVTIATELPAGGGAPDARIDAALASIPESGPQAGGEVLRCRIEPDGPGLRLTAEIALPMIGQQEIAVIETADPGAWVGDALSRREAGRLVATSMILPTTAAPLAVDRDGVTITILSENRAIEMKGCPTGP